MDAISTIRTEAQRFADALAVTGPDVRCPTCPDRSASDLLALRVQATTALLAQLGRLDDAEPRWSRWPPDELTAAMPVDPIGPDGAAGAVDHAVDVMWGWPPDGAGYQARAVVEFVAPDVDRRWLVEVGHSTVGPRAVRAAAGEPTATVRGPVGDLALWGWTRGGAVEISGDDASVEALNAVVADGMQ